MKKFLTLPILIFFLIGCAKLAHIDELLALKAMSDNQTANDRYVKNYDAKFAELVQLQKTDGLNKYPTTKSILHRFGKPIYIETANDGTEKWTYRQAVKFFDSEIVILYFQDEKLVRSEYLPAPEKVAQENAGSQTANPTP